MNSKFKSLKNNQGFMKYFKNTSWLLGEKILGMFVGLFIGVWIARYLGPEQFGLLSYAQSFVGIFAVIATFGLDSIVIRELVKEKRQINSILGTAFLLKFLGSLLVLLILAVVVNFTSNDEFTNILIFILASTTIFQSFSVVDMYFQSRVLSKYVVYSKLITLIILSIIKVVLLLNEAPLIAFVWATLFDSFILTIGLIYFYFKNKLSLKSWKVEKSMLIILLKDSWPLFLSAIFVSIYMKIDQIMIKEMLGLEAVGQYAVAVKICTMWYFIPVIIVSSLFPAIINAKKQSEKVYFDRLQKLYDFMVWIGVLIAIPMTFISNWIINFLYGSQYNEAGSVLVINIWAGIFIFLTVASGKYLTVENMTKKIFYRNIFGALINITLNLAIIPFYGIKGAAIATLVSWFFAGYLYDYFDKDVRKMFLQKTKSLNLFRIYFHIKALKNGNS